MKLIQKQNYKNGHINRDGQWCTLADNIIPWQSVSVTAKQSTPTFATCRKKKVQFSHDINFPVITTEFLLQFIRWKKITSFVLSEIGKPSLQNVHTFTVLCSVPSVCYSCYRYTNKNETHAIAVYFNWAREIRIYFNWDKEKLPCVKFKVTLQITFFGMLFKKCL